MNILSDTKTIIALGFLLLGILILSTSKLPESTQYYLTVDELLLSEKSYAGQNIKVAGLVVENSVDRDAQHSTWNFLVRHENQSLAVFFEGAMPDTFSDKAEVVLTGRYDESSRQFIATQVLAKCASRYEEKLNRPLEEKENKTKDA
ncbi:MAG: cytochrome c maturation protein CcmE [Bdellovibrionales bacterium]|nr:cytochrome c maturation protein CcmE [Bdellovibrionales bacterium]